MNLLPLPAFQDNDLWLLHDGHRALVVDPGGAQPVLAGLQQGGLQLEAILVTRQNPAPIGGLLADLKVAKTVEPDNLKLIHYIERCQKLRAQNLPTLPK